MCLLESDEQLEMQYLNMRHMNQTMWWTPTRGLLTAARDFAALEPTLSIPKYHS